MNLFNNDLGRIHATENSWITVVVLGIVYTVMLLSALYACEGNKSLIGLTRRNKIKIFVQAVIGMLTLLALQNLYKCEYDQPTVFNRLYVIIIIIFLISVLQMIVKKAPRAIILFLPVLLMFISSTSYKFGVQPIVKTENKQIIKIAADGSLTQNETEYDYSVMIKGVNYATTKKYTILTISDSEQPRIEVETRSISFKTKDNIWGKLATGFGYTMNSGKSNHYHMYVKRKSIANNEKDINSMIETLKKNKNVEVK